MRIACAAQTNLLPMEVRALRCVAGALKAAGYRSSLSYLLLWKQEHAKSYPWTPELPEDFKQVRRSILRGLGPGKRAAVYLPEELISRRSCTRAVVDGGPICPGIAAIGAAWWLLRGLEAASITGRQLLLDRDRKIVALGLACSKSDPVGRGATRKFRCTCDLARLSSPSGGPFDPLCPFHLMADLCAERAKRNFSPDHGLFPSEDGTVTTRKAVIESLRVVTGQSRVTEHSPKRSGVQWLAR